MCNIKSGRAAKVVALLLVSLSAACPALMARNSVVHRLPGSNTVLCGAMVYNDLWGMVDENGNYLYPITAGIYSFGARPDETPKSLYRNDKLIKMRAGVKVNSIYYVISTSNYDSEAYLTTYYTGSWSQRSDEEIDLVNVPSDLTYDPVTGNVYGFFFNDATQDYDRFCRFDTYYGEAEQISTVDRNAFAIAANKNGEIYGIWGWTGWLIKIDPATGRYEQIGKTGFAPALINSLTFDDATGKLYWTANDAEGYSALLEVNTTTGAATEICHFENNATFAGIYAMPYSIPDAAPAAVGEAAVEFTAIGSTSGKIKCVAPTKTHNGDTLSGPLTIAISINGCEPLEIAGVQPGSAVESEIMTFPEGAVTVDITAATDEYLGETVTVSTWAGEDIPGVPENVKLTDDNGTPVLSWTAPSKGVNGGVFDPAGVTYTITRLPDKTEFTGVTATTWRDETFSGMSALHYEVKAVNKRGSSPAATSPTMVFGEGFTVPFTEAFSTEADFNLWTVTDLNGGTTWEYDAKNKKIYYKYGTVVELEGDDWIVSPRFRLKAGQVYALTFDSKSYYKNYPENFKFALCRSTDPASVVKVIIDCPDYDVPTGETKRALFTVDADGYYHLGLHCYSIAHNWQLEIDNISLAEVDGSVPAAVKNLAVTPGEQGAMTARISFAAPTADSKGNALERPIVINVYRNMAQSPCHSFADVQAGASLDWTDTTFEEAGVYTYRVVGVGEAGEGSSAEASAFVGVDAPGAVRNLKAVENADGTVRLSWDAPTAGANGGYFNPEGLTYRIMRSNDAALLAENHSATDFTDTTLKLKRQELMYYLVTPYSGMTKGQYNNTPLNGVFGPALKAPLTETFPGAEISNYPWVSESDGPQYLWTLETAGSNPSVSDSNGDRGLAMFISNSATKGVTGEFSSPKIDISELDAPTMNFWFYNVMSDAEESEQLTLKVMTPGGDFEPVEGFTARRNGDADGWHRYSADLSAYKGAPWIRVMFTACAKGLGNMFIDNISFDNRKGIDIALGSVSGSKRVASGVAATYKARLTNEGVDAASGVAVSVSSAGNVLASVNVGSMSAGEVRDVEIEVALGETGVKRLTFEAACSGDALAANNTAAFSVEVVEPVIAAPSGLAAECGVDGVSLTWSDPYARGHVTDDVESYMDWAIDGIGDYTMVDLDFDNTYYISKDLDEYPAMASPKAFQICNAKTLGIDIWDEGTPHSGNKMFMSIASMTTANNDWLISPMLNGRRQTVSFYAKAFTAEDTPAERMRVLYSLTGTEPSEFTAVHTADYIEVPAEWTEYRFVLPEGAKYFAINCVSENAFALFVDDLSFNDMTVPALDVTAYEVMRNGSVIGRADGCSFTDGNPVVGKSTYSVRALYDGDTASALSESVDVEFSSLADVAAPDVAVSGGRGSVVVANAAGLPVTLVAIDGRRIYASADHGDRLTIPAQPGFYIVTVGSRTYKVRVL